LVLNPADDEVSQLFADHEFFIFPARWEHFGMVSVEAIQAGLTPLVHDSGGQREIVPIDTLRFKGETDLVEKAGALLSTTPSDRRDMLVGLQRHAARGSPERYCREMILPLCREWSLTYPEK
jgi:glycosyltransferase involved in cell wall biosynthesis